MILFLNNFHHLNAQNFIKLQLSSPDTTIQKFITTKKNYKLFLNVYLNSLKNLGFTSATIDSISIEKSDTILAKIYLGNLYFIDTAYFVANNDTQIIATNFIFNKKNLKKIINSQIHQYLNNGYPLCNYTILNFKIAQKVSLLCSKNQKKFLHNKKLAQIAKKSFQLTNLHKINIIILRPVVKLNSGQFFAFDTLYAPDTIKISKKFLAAYLDIKPGKPYNDKKIRQIPQKIAQLGFLQQTGAIKKEFYPGLVKIILPLRKINSNSLEAIAGLKFENKKLQTSGKIDLELQNFFQTAENIKIQWQKPKQNWQQLYISTNFPYFAGWPLGFNANFFIQKIDTTQLNLFYTANLAYFIDGLNRIDFGFNSEKNLTNITDSANYNITKHNFDFGINLYKFDNRLLPDKGYQLNLKLFYGQKLWKSNRTSNFSTTVKSALIIPIIKNFDFKLSAQGYFHLSQPIFDNEVKFIGGVENFWGFDEKSFKATSYWLVRAEPGFNFNHKINFSLWAIKGQIFTKTLSYKKQIAPFSTGLRFIFTTKNSTFNIIYAIGTTNNKLNLQQSKFHISYKTRF